MNHPHTTSEDRRVARPWPVLLLVPALFLATACGGGGDDGDNQAPPAAVNAEWDQFDWDQADWS